MRHKLEITLHQGICFHTLPPYIFQFGQYVTKALSQSKDSEYSRIGVNLKDKISRNPSSLPFWQPCDWTWHEQENYCKAPEVEWSLQNIAFKSLPLWLRGFVTTLWGTKKTYSETQKELVCTCPSKLQHDWLVWHIWIQWGREWESIWSWLPRNSPRNKVPQAYCE